MGKQMCQHCNKEFEMIGYAYKYTGYVNCKACTLSKECMSKLQLCNSCGK